MNRYLFRRTAQSIFSLLALVSIVFLLSRLIGDPSVTLLPMEATVEDQAAIRAMYGLDQPLYVQYLIFLKQLVTGDFGTAYFWHRPVGELLMDRLPASLELLFWSMVVALAFAIVPGVYAAVWRGSRFDFAARTIGSLGGAIPSFWLGLVLMMIFSVWLQILPVSGRDGFASIVLPALTLGWAISGSILRLMRSSMLDVLDREYVKLARIKGVPESRVIWVHAVKNALLPVVTFTGSIMARLLGAAIVVETVFAWPGLGRLLMQAVNARDFPVIQGIVFTLGAFQILISISLDIIYAWINPRIRFA
jgi:peptide/nickel transport system permease protein